METDLIIPLGIGSKSNNDELRILLRSVQKYAVGLGRVIIAAARIPEWLDTSKCEAILVLDTHYGNKDANIIDKVLSAIVKLDVDSFVFAADDNVFMRRTVLSEIPVLHSAKTRKDYGNSNLWQQRMCNTFDYFNANGTKLVHSYETHCPQFFGNAKELSALVAQLPYKTYPGLTIMSAFRCVMPLSDSELSDKYCDYAFYRQDMNKILYDKNFLSYKDETFIGAGLREALFDFFREKSIYEK